VTRERVRRIGRRKLADAVGVTPAAITHLTQNGGALREAANKRGVDIDHPSVRKWLKKRKVALTKVVSAYEGRPAKSTKARPKRPKTKGQTKRSPSALPDDPDELTLEQVQRMKIRDLRAVFQTSDDLEVWLNIAKKHADTKEKELKNLATQSRVIDRELVRVHVFGMLEAAHQRLLGDAPKTIATKILALGATGGTLEEAEAVVRDVVSSQLVPAVNKTTKALRR
jgi:hypothetical protein